MDQRTAIDKMLWEKVGPPLYYCSDCLRAVKVQPVEGAEPTIDRPCGDECGHGIIAPRRAVCVGKGGASMPTKVKIATMKLAAAITGRNV